MSFFLFVAIFLFTLDALACPVCFSAKEGTLNAFYFTTALLTLLPLSMFAAIFWWFRRQMKKKSD